MPELAKSEIAPTLVHLWRAPAGQARPQEGLPGPSHTKELPDSYLLTTQLNLCLEIEGGVPGRLGDSTTFSGTPQECCPARVMQGWFSDLGCKWSLIGFPNR
jgi:hypothetical protein